MNPAEFANIARSERDFWWYRGMREILARLLPAHIQGRVLEAGCGTGYQAGVLERERGWRVTPIDLGWEGLQQARRLGLERLAQADVAALPFRDAAFTAVLSLDVMVHFHPGQEARAIRELARVTARGGLVILRVAALEALRSRHSQFAAERQRFTRARLLGLVRACGLRVRRCTYANTLLLPVALLKFRVWEPLLRRPPASGVAPVAPWLNRLLYLPLALEARWLGSGRDLPLGQSLILLAEKP